MPSYRTDTPARRLLPRAVAALGEVGPCVIHDPNARGGGGAFLAWEPKPGTILAADEDGRTLFFLRPLAHDEEPRPCDQAIRAARLYERFTHRRADGFHNAIVPHFRRPRFAGELVILRYAADKAEDLEDEDGPIEWEHYFEKPGDRPAYPQVFAVGNDQYVIPPGAFEVRPEGITYAPHPSQEIRR